MASLSAASLPPFTLFAWAFLAALLPAFAMEVSASICRLGPCVTTAGG
jgi:hypothetical protein